MTYACPPPPPPIHPHLSLSLSLSLSLLPSLPPSPPLPPFLPPSLPPSSHLSHAGALPVLHTKLCQHGTEPWSPWRRLASPAGERGLRGGGGGGRRGRLPAAACCLPAGLRGLGDVSMTRPVWDWPPADLYGVLPLSKSRLVSWFFFSFVRCNVCFFVACLTSQQHASVSQGRVCSDNFTCCHTEVEVADQTFHLTQSQYSDTGPTSPSADPITPGAWQGGHWSANF